MDTTTNNTEAPTPKPFDRNAIREAVLTAKEEEHLVECFGTTIAIRPPSLTGMMAYKDFQQDEYMLARAILDNCYVPGSREKVFEETDLEVIGSKEYGTDMKKLNNAIQKVLGDEETIAKKVEDNTKSPEA